MAYTKTVWQDQEGQVRYTETPDGDYKIFTPNYEEVTEIGTPVNALNMNHIEDGIEYCDTNMVKRKSTSQATGSTTQPVYVKADGTVETCTIDVSNTRFDGQWTSSVKTLSTATAIGNYEIDLSDYLPDDEYSYEVLTCLFASRSSGDTNSSVSIKESSSTASSADDMATTKCYGYMSFDGNHAEGGNMSCVVVVGTGRKIYMGIANAATGKTVFIATKYRRVGTNQ